jgi:hypothetical protein
MLVGDTMQSTFMDLTVAMKQFPMVIMSTIWLTIIYITPIMAIAIIMAL